MHRARVYATMDPQVKTAPGVRCVNSRPKSQGLANR